MKTFSTITSRVVPLAVNNVDTDQIIPARFLKVTDKEGLADCLFFDWRQDPTFVINQPENQGSQILLAGDNFGSGSSREHAPWALTAWGFRVVLSTSFADIFKSNALKNSLLPVVVSEDVLRDLFATREANADMELTVDLSSQRVTVPGGDQVTFEVDGFAKHCLLKGMDQLDYLRSFGERVRAYEQARNW